MSYNDWDQIKIGDLGEVVSGGTPSTKNDAYWNGEIPWITPKDLSGFRSKYIKSGERKITSLGLKNSSAKIIPLGSILFSSRAPIGYVVIALNALCTNQGFKSIIPSHKHDNEFIYYLLKYHTEKIQNSASGSTFREISGSAFKNIEVKAPSLREQEVIANILSSLDDKIELNNKINKNLEETAQTLYKRWFVDFDFPNEFGEPYQSSGGEMIDSELGLIPKGWHITDLSELIKKEKEKSMGDLNLRLIDMANMPSYSISLNQFADGDKLTTNIFKMKKMSFLYGSIRPYLGKFGIAPFDGITTGTIHNFTVKKTDDYSYIAGIIFSKKFNDFCIRLSHGTKMPVINWDNFASYKIVYNKNLAINFNKLLLSSIKKIIQNVNENINLAETRDLLLPKLMSGEIEVEIEE